jgi:hypothetical protein
MLEDAFIHSDQEGLTEAFLAQEFGWQKEAPPPARGRETVAWFMDRQVRAERVQSRSQVWVYRMTVDIVQKSQYVSRAWHVQGGGHCAWDTWVEVRGRVRPCVLIFNLLHSLHASSS